MRGRQSTDTGARQGVHPSESIALHHRDCLTSLQGAGASIDRHIGDLLLPIMQVCVESVVPIPLDRVYIQQWQSGSPVINVNTGHIEKALCEFL